MQAHDIAQVIEIERQSFPTVWPQTAYERELNNRMARYIVACERDERRPAAGGPAPSRPAGSLLRRLFSTPAAVAPANEAIVGIVGVWLMVSEAHIVTIAVPPARRRQGVGEVLLLAAIEAAFDAHQDDVTLEYRISNGTARALYEKYGFTQVGVRARYYTDNQEDAVLMTTPPLRSPPYRRLLAQRIAEQRARWGEGYPLAGRLPYLERA